MQYRRLYDQLASEPELLAQLPPMQQSWADQLDKAIQSEQDDLEQQVAMYRQNLIRTSTRTAFLALGELQEAHGDFTAALRSYIRTQDYCTTTDHVLEMCLHVIEVSLLVSNYVHVQNYVNKAEQSQGISDRPGVVSLLKAVSGVAYMESQKYKSAARKFLEVDFGAQHKQPQLAGSMLCPEDIATYGALCALSEFSRRELKTELLDNPRFRQFLALVPPVERLVLDFYASRYADCLVILNSLRLDLLATDMIAHKHVSVLAQNIRHRALQQYFRPYVAVDLHKMAAAFQVGVPELEKELAELITKDIITARIDSHNKRLVAQQADVRSNTFRHGEQVGADFQTSSRAMLLRINLIRANFMVKPQKQVNKRKAKGQ